MKKGRPKKKPPRFSTRILLAALAAALAINGYFAWQILGKPLQTEQTQTAAGTVPAEVQERLDAQEERENEIAESGSVSYSPSGDRLNDREAGAVHDESSAMDALEALHVETVVLLSHKSPDSVINVKVEFGEGDDKISLDAIAERAKKYQPNPKITYKMIQEYVEKKYGFKVHTAYIAEVKRSLGLTMYDAPNATEELKQPRKRPLKEKAELIKTAAESSMKGILPVVDDFLVLACAPSHPFASRKEIFFHELNDQFFALREPGSGTRDLFERTLQGSGIHIKIACEANTPQAIRNMVMYNDCLTVISIRLIENEVRAGNIHVIRNSTSEWDRKFFLVTHKNKTFTPAMQRLKELSMQYRRPTLPEDIPSGILLP